MRVAKCQHLANIEDQGHINPVFPELFFFFNFLEYSCFSMLFLDIVDEVNDKYCNIRKGFYS